MEKITEKRQEIEMDLIKVLRVFDDEELYKKMHPKMSFENSKDKRDGSEKASYIARKTLQKVYRKVGLYKAD